MYGEVHVVPCRQQDTGSAVGDGVGGHLYFSAFMLKPTGGVFSDVLNLDFDVNLMNNKRGA